MSEDEHLSKDGYYHELIEDNRFIVDVLDNPKKAVHSYGLEWDPRNNARLAVARENVLEYAKRVLGEVRVLNFRNCEGGGGE